MMNHEVTILQREARTIYGLWGRSSDKTIAKDIPALSKKYRAVANQEAESVPFYVLNKDYEQKSAAFDLFIGGESAGHGLEAYTLPEGSYAKIVVKPKFGFLWGPSIGEAKRFFYEEWLPASSYSPLNMEYEFHSERSLDRKPEIDIFFSLMRK